MYGYDGAGESDGAGKCNDSRPRFIGCRRRFSFQLPLEQIDEAVAIVRGTARAVEITGTVQVVSDDPSDDKFVETAQIAGVDYLVSGDRHLLTCHAMGDVRVVTARGSWTSCHNRANNFLACPPWECKGPAPGVCPGRECIGIGR